MTTSTFAANFFWFLLSINWLAEGRWADKWQRFRQSSLLQAFMILCGVHLLWLVGSSNMHYALHDLQVKLPLLASPLVTLTTSALSQRERHWVLWPYVATVVVVSLIGLVRWFSIADLPYRQIVPFISHIRFSLNVCLVIAIGVAWLQQSKSSQRRLWHSVVAVAVLLWLLAFLLLIHSYTALVILLIIFMADRLRDIIRSRTLRGRVSHSVLLLTVIAIIVLSLYRYVSQYYTMTPLETKPLPTFTAGGHRYSHDNGGPIENGGHINNYICQEELRSTWSQRSTLPFDTLTRSGHPVYPTLVRYLGSRGLTKDSVGVMQLTQADIDAIERGTANVVYTQPDILRRMVYQLLFEYENYKAYGSVNNSSMGERLLLWQNGWQVFCQHPLTGVGTGDVADVCHQRLTDTHSQLAGTTKHLHNQYLSMLVAFGLVGVAIVAAFFVRAWHRRRHPMAWLAVVYILIVLLSMMAEDTLETLAGILFCTFPIVLLRSAEDTTQPSSAGDATVPNSHHPYTSI